MYFAVGQWSGNCVAFSFYTAHPMYFMYVASHQPHISAAGSEGLSLPGRPLFSVAQLCSTPAEHRPQHRQPYSHIRSAVQPFSYVGTASPQQPHCVNCYLRLHRLVAKGKSFLLFTSHNICNGPILFSSRFKSHCICLITDCYLGNAVFIYYTYLI